jgi:2-polyprenyl-6-methoxyphenol hydroxylase-like FAD-dependent oxidoreductase
MTGSANVGIVGGGVSALHLGLGLVSEGAAVTIYEPQTPAQIASGRLLNTVAHMPDTVERERALGVDFWDEGSARICHVRHYSIHVGDGRALDCYGALNGDERCIDYRVYLPRLMGEFDSRGGRLVHKAASPEVIDELYETHSLLAIASGRANGGFADFFPRIDELSIHDSPPRLLCAGLYTGVADCEPRGVTVATSPGQGELIVLPMETAHGPLMALLFENVPGRDLADLVTLDYSAGAAAFNSRILDALESHHPSVFARVDKDDFRLFGAEHLLQGSFTPITRKPWAEIRDGCFAVAIGDLRCTQDPVTGQGANLASRNASELARHILDSDDRFDRAFCEEHEQATQYKVAGTVCFNNEILNPAPHTQQLLGAITENQAMCDDFSTRFAAPHTLWFDVLKDAQTCAAYMARFN